MGRREYPEAKRILICADSGGSNGSRVRAWKLYLQKLSDEFNLTISVCHYPPGTSKWNKIEHRMFSFISTGIKISDKEMKELKEYSIISYTHSGTIQFFLGV